jgi:hypothetical protein
MVTPFVPLDEASNSSIRFLLHNSYTQELPGRFKKDIVKAAIHDPSHGVALEGMQRVLHNIGAAHAMSVAEMKLIFEELGDNTGEIPVQSIGEIL